MKKKLRIAMFCSTEWPTPPPQDVIFAPLWIHYYVAEGLAKRGHEVFYFGPKESKMKYAKLVSCDMSAMRNNTELFPLVSMKTRWEAVIFYEQTFISKMYEMNSKKKFDVIHTYRNSFPFASLTKTPTVVTIHDPIEKIRKYRYEWTRQFPQIHFISISDAQRSPAPDLNYLDTIYHGIDLRRFQFNAKPDDYFVIAGRMLQRKGIGIAIQVAKKAGVKLKIAGGPAKGLYWEKSIKPYLGKDIEYVGMVDYYCMGDFFRKAKGFISPQRWNEPFGLTFVEAMACGTPVITFHRGSAPEVVAHGKTGFVVRSVPQMIEAIKNVDTIKREDCRKHVEEHFSVKKMVDRYEEVFLKLAESK